MGDSEFDKKISTYIQTKANQLLHVQSVSKVHKRYISFESKGIVMIESVF